MDIENVERDRRKMTKWLWSRHKDLLILAVLIMAVVGVVEFVKWLTE